MLLLVAALWFALKNFGIVGLAPAVDGTVGLGAIFIIGLVAATSSCLAVVGGLLLSVSAKYAEAFHPKTRWEKFRPLFLFNLGRLAGYFLLGGLAGLLGRSLTLSPYSTGLLTAIVAAVMIVLGLNILRILPKKFCTIPLSAEMTKRIHALSRSRNPLAPLFLGAMTFFLPCGFTQSVQLLALSSGSFLAGGAIMLAFALGTLPALLGISIVSSIVEGRAARVFLNFSGAVVLLLGVFNFQNGLLLMGHDVRSSIARFFPSAAHVQAQTDDPYVSIDAKGRQIMSVYVSDTGYAPDNFTIRPGLETWVYAIAKDSLSGCLSFLVDSTHNLQTPIAKGGNWLGPITNPKNDFVLTCSMGMFRANVHVKNG